MFGKEKSNQLEQGQISGPASAPPVQPTPVKSYDVYTLPEQFLPSAKSKKTSNKSTNKLLYVLLILMVALLLVGAGIWYFYRYQNGKSIDIGPTTNIAPLDENEPTVENPPEPIEPVLPPQPIVYVAKDNRAEVIGVLTLQLAVADRNLLNEISISSTQSSDNPKVVGAFYRIDPQGRSLQGEAIIKIEYFDQAMTSVFENSLRIGFERSLNDWIPSEDSVIDLGKNEISLTVRQIPRTRLAIVSNLTMQEITAAENPPDENNTTEFVNQDPQSSEDADSDLLTDVEELMYGTDFNLPDTDGDGYLDGEELLNFYSPLAVGVNLKDSGLFQAYRNTPFDYEIIYPTAWTVNALDESEAVIIFSSPTSQFVQIVVEERAPGLATVADWYASQVPGLNTELIRTTVIGRTNLPAIISLDGKTIYFFYQDKVIAFSYNLGIEQAADYLTTWQVMRKSFTNNPDLVSLPSEPPAQPSEPPESAEPVAEELPPVQPPEPVTE